ncbi:MAG: VanZ family protein [Bacteroidota bacterium]|nr:VanZ family protein [Bacteroidota bacterium]
MQKISFKKFLPGIAWFFIVLYLTCLPGNDLPKIGWLTKIIFFDKWVHIGLFGMLMFLFCFPFYRSSFTAKERLYYFIKIAIAVSVWGLTIEFIQKYFVPGRSFDLLDWFADSLGAAIAYWFCSKKFRNDA